MHGAVEGLPGEGLLMHGAVGIAVEEAAEFGFQFADALGRGLTSSQARSWSLSQPPPSIVSMKWRSTESSGDSATL